MFFGRPSLEVSRLAGAFLLAGQKKKIDIQLKKHPDWDENWPNPLRPGNAVLASKDVLWGMRWVCAPSAQCQKEMEEADNAGDTWDNNRLYPHRFDMKALPDTLR